MEPLLENYLSLYIAIIKKSTPDEALRAMGIVRGYNKANSNNGAIYEGIKL